ncbi:MAG: sulfite exporter TauE/SafE family protein [Hyphomicrobiaceae bacterium]
MWADTLRDATMEFVGPISNQALAFTIVSVMLAGFLRGFLGFGGALVIIMVLNVVLGPQVAVPIACLSGLPATMQLLPQAMRACDRRFVVPFGLTSFAIAPVGTLLLVSIHPAVMKITISAFVLAMVVMLYRGWRLAQTSSPAATVAAGAVAGFIQGTAGVGGPPAVVAALSFPGSAEKQRANVIGAVTSLSLAPIIPLWLANLFSWRIVVASLMIIPIYSATTWFGSQFFSQHGQQHYRNVTYLALTAMSVITLAIAIGDYTVY